MSYDKTETRELNTPALNEEELDVIEVLDHRALFSNGRIKPEHIPEDFGKDGYIPLDDDTEPNFLGETMTASEFVDEETQDEVMRMNGM